MARVAIVGSGLAGFTAYQTLRRALAPGEIAVFGTDADPAAGWRVRAAAIRQREMRSESDGHCLPDLVPWARLLERPSVAARRGRCSSRCSTATTRRWTSSSRTSNGCASGAAGTRAWSCAGSSACRRSTAASTLDGERFRARAARARPSGAERPRGATRRPAGRPLVRAARLRGHRHGRRGGPRGGDRVAERARGGRRGGVGAPARAGAPPAQRAAPLLLPPRARRLPPPAAARAGRAPAHADRALVPGRAPVGRAARARGARRAGSAWSSP